MDVKIRVRVWGGGGGQKGRRGYHACFNAKGQRESEKKMAAKPKQTVGQMMNLDTD